MHNKGRPFFRPEVTDSKPVDMSPPVVWPVMNLEKQIETCRKENIKTHNDEISSSCDPGYVPHHGSCKVKVMKSKS